MGCNKVIQTLVYCFLCLIVVAQSPSEISGLELWLRADSISNSGAQFTWYDKSGNNFDAFQNDFTRAPTSGISSQLGNREYLLFDGVNDRLQMDSSIVVGTAFAVVNCNSETGLFPNYDGVLTAQSGGNDRIIFIGLGGASTIYTNGFFGANISVNETSQLNFAPLVNWKFLKGQSTVPSIFDNLYVGTERGSNARSWDGGIAEIIIFSSVLSESEIEMVQTYLYNRYTPAFTLEDNISSPDFCSINLYPGEGFIDYTWEGENGSDSLTVTETGQYTIEVESSFGKLISDTIKVQFPGTFINSFSLCQNSDSLYTTNLEAFDVEWQDGSTTPNYDITQGGDYSLTVTDAEGCSYQSDTVVVTEDFFPTEVEINENNNFCLGNELYLSSGFAEAVTTTWSTGEEGPFIAPQSSGTYWVEATNANGCVGRDTVDVELVGTAPYVEFNTGTACAENAVVFTDTTFPEGAEITNEEWTFGFAPFGFAQGVAVEYEFPGTGEYPVELTVTLDNGCTGTGRDTVWVSPLPLVGFNYDAVTPCRGNEAAFESESGVPGNGTIASYAWTFGNGTTDTGLVGTTTFEEMGTNTVQLAVTTTAGCVDSLLADVVVRGSPVVEFSFDTVCVGMATVFNEEVDTEESGPVFYNWQFGDGYFSGFPNTAHVYAAPGVYSVELTATGNDFGGAGCVDQATREVRVYAAPTGAMAATDGCLGTELELTDMTVANVQGGVADPVAERTWTLPFGYGQGPVALGGDSVQVWMAEEAGNFGVHFDFVTAAGCAGSAAGSATVLAVPEADFLLDVPETMPPLVVSPVNLSTGAQGYAWLVDDVVVSSEFEPEILFADTGDYVVALAATNSLGCNDTLAKSVRVISPVYDVALLDIRYAVVGDRLQLRLLLSNNGNTAVRDFVVGVRLGLSADVVSTEEFELAAGDVGEYVLPQDFEYLTSRDLPYVCVDIDLRMNGVDVAEEDEENNGLCVGLEKSKAVFIDPYPNPGSGEVKLGFVLPGDGVVGLSVVDSEGREVGGYSWDLKAGYSLEGIDVSGYEVGMYMLRYSFFGDVVVKKLVVVR